MTGPSRYRGFASLDALASLLPILLMLLLLGQASHRFAESARMDMHRQEVLNKLVSIADRTVKSGAAVREGDIRYPNWVDESRLTGSYMDGLRAETGLEELAMTLRRPPERPGVCIYRLVVIGEDRALERLFVCGG